MLLPSDVARLVLGYLQEEGLSSTSRTFINESPNLKEYAEHSTEDGVIPACVFSLFGKNLTTIVNEYAAAKAKETSHEIPVMMTSLWKKLDFTLNQIKSLQNSPAIAASQRTRSRTGVANMTRQRALTMSPACSVVCSTPDRGALVSSMHTSHSIPGHSTPLGALGSTQLQIQDGCRMVNRDPPVQMLVPDHRLTPSPMSPGRRKWDFPKRRGGGTTPTGRSTMAVSSLAAEQQAEEVANENFPQLVIQNAREKILSDKLLQEKLAENINKILASDPTPQCSKASCSTVEPDQSIDEILGLQGEIHMSDDAIHDILEQTESDPAFQALFDLFDYNKAKVAEIDPVDVSASLDENNAANPSSVNGPLQNEVDLGNAQGNVSSATSATAILEEKAGQEATTRKTRKSCVPSSTKRIVLVPRGTRSRIEKSTARLLVRHTKQPAGPLTAAVDLNGAQKLAPFPAIDIGAQMDVDESLSVLASSSDNIPSQDAMELARTSSSTTTATAPNAPNLTLSTCSNTELGVVEITSSSDENQVQGDKALGGAGEINCLDVNEARTSSISSPAQTSQLGLVLLGPQEPNKTLLLDTPLPHTIAAASVALSPPISSPVPVPGMPNPPTNNPIDPGKGEADPNNIVSLKIIISDEQTETSSSSKALNQAISSISGDKIPTIFLSSPTKSAQLLGGLPSTPQTNPDEIAQAVNSLQSSEVLQPTVAMETPISGLAQLAGESQAQPSYIIQLPLDTTNSSVPGATASYLLVTDPQKAPQTRPLLVPAGVSQGQPLPATQYALATPPHAQSYTNGSPFILQSPVRPMMVPLSVIGQNNVGKLPLISNQFVAIPSSLPKLQPGPAEPKPPTHTGALKHAVVSKAVDQNVPSIVAQYLSTEKPDLQEAPAGTSPSHRRILCFDSAGATLAHSQSNTTSITTPTTTPPTPNTSGSLPGKQPGKQPGKFNPKLSLRAKPAILGGNKAKRRIETIRCTADTQARFGLSEETEKHLAPEKQQRENIRKTPRKQDHKLQVENARAVDISQPDATKDSDSERPTSKARKQKETNGNQAKSNDLSDAQSSKSLPPDAAPKSTNKNDGEDSPTIDPAEKGPGKSREGRPEKKASQEPPNVTANKENEEVVGSRREQQSVLEVSTAPVIPPAPTPQLSKTPSKTSSLTKQAAEMLHDFPVLNPTTTTPVRRTRRGSADPPRTPGAGRSREEPADGPRTPARQRLLRDGEGTPRRLIPPTTPEIPTCSPASEAGSESSINMAAHTLMILSRAAIARTGSPLKDSLRQEGDGENASSTAKNSKKRNQTTPLLSPPAKKERRRSSSCKKKEKKQKKIVDCFPDDLDVDKFLSLLHYDE